MSFLYRALGGASRRSRIHGAARSVTAFTLTEPSTSASTTHSVYPGRAIAPPSDRQSSS